MKIDFPRIPYPKDVTAFWDLVKLGGELRTVHLLESQTLKPTTRYSVDGDNVVSKLVYKGGSVYINDTQYFANVPHVAWDFYIGGYQPAQKWLKDRLKDGKELSYEDIKHYQKIISALVETDRIMQEIDVVYTHALGIGNQINIVKDESSSEIDIDGIKFSVTQNELPVKSTSYYLDSNNSWLIVGDGNTRNPTQKEWEKLLNIIKSRSEFTSFSNPIISDGSTIDIDISINGYTVKESGTPQDGAQMILDWIKSVQTVY